MVPRLKYSVSINGNTYDAQVIRRITENRESPRLVTVCYIANPIAMEITKVCIQSIQCFTDTPYELWVVDNNSPEEYVDWICQQPNLNLILNRTTPFPKPRGVFETLRRGQRKHSKQLSAGSYANAVGLELAAQIIDADLHYLFIMHNDVLVCKSGWLGFLMSKLNEKTRGAAVSHDPIRVKAMHASGFLFDFSLFKPLNMSFLPNLPHYDVGDLITICLRQAGYDYYVCRNTFNHPETIELISRNDPLREMHCDRVFDDNENLIYLHLGRGTPKAIGTYNKIDKIYPERWVHYAMEYLLS
jgi:hypothetical protein